ncbi:MAG: hypothetical protein RID91_21055 [Azospirillaceae bacterium]
MTDAAAHGRVPEALRDLAPVINAAGTMTALGASAVPAGTVAVVAEILPRFVLIEELQARASAAIAAATGAEAGFVTGCAAAGVTVSVAATIAGTDPGAIERLPDPGGRPATVVMQTGHLVNYGAPVDQAVRAAGATVRPIGQVTEASVAQLRAGLDETVCAGLYVVSHHCVQRGQIPLDAFARACHAHGVPVIVDAASEYDLRGFLARGGDLVVYSAQKFLAGPTAGIIAGRAGLVAACAAQSRGLGRMMKPGKEAIAGTIAALDAWAARGHDAARAAEAARVAAWEAALADTGLGLARIPDPTGNPITRLRVTPGPAAGCAAWDFARELAAGRPVVVVRDDGIDRGYFELDPCNLDDAQAATVAERIRAVAERARRGEVARQEFVDWREGAET